MADSALNWPSKLLRPSSVAVVGASEDPRKPGGTAFQNLRAGTVRLYPVNPKYESIDGCPCFASIADVPETPDLALVAVPTPLVAEVVEQCVSLGVGVVIVVSSGFGETGEAGKELERRLVQLARGSGARLLGPNTMGVYVPATNLDTTFVPSDRWHRPLPGSIALVCQSGALGVNATELCWHYSGGISAFVTLGNKADLNERDMVEAFAQDPSTKCISFYLEGFVDGRGFYESCCQVSPHKPLVVAKSGRSAAGAKAAALHTGSLSGSDRVVNGAFKQAGIIRAYDVHDLMDYAHALAYGKPLYRPRLGVLTCAGGHGVMLADYLVDTQPRTGATLAAFSEKTMHRLNQVMLPFASAENPIDLTGSATNDMFFGALEALEADDGVDAIIVSLIPYPPLLDEGVIDVIEYWHLKGAKPIIAMVTGMAFLPDMMQRLWKAGVLAYASTRQVVNAIEVLCQRGQYLRRLNAGGA